VLCKIVLENSFFLTKIWAHVGVDVLYRRAIRTSGILPVKIFLSATCTLDEPDKHFSHKFLLYFAFFVKWQFYLFYKLPGSFFVLFFHIILFLVSVAEKGMLCCVR
jgi:hypothetical protein